MNTSETIIKYIEAHKRVTAKELVDFLSLTKQAVFRQLSDLITEGKLTKIGKPPRVFYLLAEEKKEIGTLHLDKRIEKIIQDNFLVITASGERKDGMEGFVFWCQKTNQSIEKNAVEYVKTLNKYDSFKKNGVIEGMDKLKATFNEIGLDNVLYLDFYSIEKFGKTRLGQLLLYAKQSQDKVLMRELAKDLKPKIDEIIKEYKIDGIGFIPPTVKREVQFMKELEKNLHEHVRKVSIVKVKTEVIVPQKTLNKLSDRVENAKNTIIVDEKGIFENVLLIDDAIGSGATLNETALQIKQKGIAKKVIGLSITGSFKGFDVISEV